MKNSTSIVIVSFTFLGLSLASQFSSAADIDLSPVADTTLNETFPDNNMGGHTAIHAGAANTTQLRRAVLKFAVAGSVSAGSTVNTATLQLTVPGGNVSNPSTFALHRLLVDYNEGDKAGNNGAVAAAGEATWNSAGIAPWSAPGAVSGVDYVATPSATQPVAGVGSYSFTSAQLATDVQAMLDNPASDYGWILISQSEGVSGTARRFGAREAASGIPQLQINYTEVPVELQRFVIE